MRPGQSVSLSMTDMEFSKPVPNATYEVFLLDGTTEKNLNTSEYFDYIP